MVAFNCQTSSCQINVWSDNFNYCPTVWLFSGKTILKKLEKLQERALATVYYDKSLAYQDMLKRVVSYASNWILYVSLLLVCWNSWIALISCASMKCLVVKTRDNSRSIQPKLNTKRYGYKSFKYLGSKVWNCLQPCVKNVNDLNLFKKNIYIYLVLNWPCQELARRLRAIIIRCFDTLRLCLNTRDFYKQHFYNTISSMKMIPLVLLFHWVCSRGPFENKPALVRLVVWHHSGNTPLVEPLIEGCMHHPVSLSEGSVFNLCGILTFCFDQTFSKIKIIFILVMCNYFNMLAHII